MLTSVFISSCEKSNERCENSHCDVLTCKIDGVSWAPYCESSGLFGCSSIRTRHYKDFDSEYLYIRADNSNIPNSIIMFVYLFNDSHPNLENINSSNNPYIDGNRDITCTYFSIDTLVGQDFTLYQIDLENRTVEGRFEFSVENECDNTDKVFISDGYFNLSF